MDVYSGDQIQINPRLIDKKELNDKENNNKLIKTKYNDYLDSKINYLNHSIAAIYFTNENTILSQNLLKIRDLISDTPKASYQLEYGSGYTLDYPKACFINNLQQAFLQSDNKKNTNLQNELIDSILQKKSTELIILYYLKINNPQALQEIRNIVDNLKTKNANKEFEIIKALNKQVNEILTILSEIYFSFDNLVLDKTALADKATVKSFHKLPKLKSAPEELKKPNIKQVDTSDIDKQFMEIGSCFQLEKNIKQIESDQKDPLLKEITQGNFTINQENYQLTRELKTEQLNSLDKQLASLIEQVQNELLKLVNKKEK